MSGNKILTITKGYNCTVYLQKLMCNNPNLDLVNNNDSAKFGLILSICSKNIEQKRRRYDRMMDKVKTVYSTPTANTLYADRGALEGGGCIIKINCQYNNVLKF